MLVHLVRGVLPDWYEPNGDWIVSLDEDAIDDAKALIRLLHGVKFKINLIPFNAAPNSEYQRSDWEQIQRFQRYLLDRGVVATLRISKGQDIQGACGQLQSEQGLAIEEEVR